MTRWRHYDAGRAGRMRADLQRIAAADGLSNGVDELVAKGLEQVS